MTLSIHHSVGLNQDYAKDYVKYPLYPLLMITILLTHLTSISSTNQENLKHSPLLTMRCPFQRISQAPAICRPPPCNTKNEAPIQLHQLSKRKIILCPQSQQLPEDTGYVTHRPQKYFAIAMPILFQTASADVGSIHRRRTRASSTIETKGT